MFQRQKNLAFGIRNLKKKNAKKRIACFDNATTTTTTMTTINTMMMEKQNKYNQKQCYSTNKRIPFSKTKESKQHRIVGFFFFFIPSTGPVQLILN